VAEAMIPDPTLPVVALAIGAAAAAVWSVVLVRSVRAWRAGIEHRASYVVMAGTAWLASIGTLASAVGFAIQRGAIPEVVPPDLMTLIASIGRGALLTGGLVIVTHYRPPTKRL
jgi:hypothetical protein